MPHFGRRNEIENRIDHTQTSAQNGNQSHAIGQDLRFGRHERRGYFGFSRVQVLRRLVGEQYRQSPQQLAKLGGRRRTVAQSREMMFDERVPDVVDFCHSLIG
jgi:hypothetical protein